jgi:hypothetical protein
LFLTSMAFRPQFLARRGPDHHDRHPAGWRQRRRHRAGLPHACRPRSARQGIFWGTAGAIVLRVVLIFFASAAGKLPALKLIGALLLVWIGVKLLLPEDDDGAWQHPRPATSCGRR